MSPCPFPMTITITPWAPPTIKKQASFLLVYGTGTRGLRNKRTSGDHLNYSIIEIGQNTKRPGDLRFTVGQETYI